LARNLPPCFLAKLIRPFVLTDDGRRYQTLAKGFFCMKPVLLAGLFTLVLSAAASAGGAFDGRWAVEIFTARGDCDRATSWSVAVASGRIAESGSFGTAAGAVDSQGRVRLQVVNGGDRMSASGKLKGAAGGGAWSSPSRACSGRWRARRA
jgi:hypothetical protein